MTEKPGPLRVLIQARELLSQRGWTASSIHRSDNWLGDTPGPLTLTRALWVASRWGSRNQYLAPDASGRACQWLCAMLWPEQMRRDPLHYGFVELGRWTSRRGRTEAEVLALLDRTIHTGQGIAQRFMDQVALVCGEPADG